MVERNQSWIVPDDGSLEALEDLRWTGTDELLFKMGDMHGEVSLKPEAWTEASEAAKVNSAAKIG